MVEYIKREDAINLLWLYADESCASVVSDFESLPAVPVVRCRECENYDENGDCISLDLRIGIHSDTINYDFCPDPDFYCAYGRRKIETVLPKSDAKYESLGGYHEVS